MTLHHKNIFAESCKYILLNLQNYINTEKCFIVFPCLCNSDKLQNQLIEIV